MESKSSNEAEASVIANNKIHFSNEVKHVIDKVSVKQELLINCLNFAKLHIFHL